MNNDEKFTGAAAGWTMIIFLLFVVGAVLYQAMRLAGFDPFEFWRGLL